MHLTYEIRSVLYALLPNHLRHGVEIFSDYSLLLDVAVFILEIGKNTYIIYKMPTNLFISFAFQQEVRSSSRMYESSSIEFDLCVPIK